MPRLLSFPVCALLFACAATAPSDDECVTATLEAELGAPASECPTASVEAIGKADGAGVTSPGLDFLRSRSERDLAGLFAGGSADRLPTGRNHGTPLLLGLDWLTPALNQVYVGSIWDPATDSQGSPLLWPNGDPVIRLRDAWLRTRDGHLVTLFEADVTRGTLASVVVAPGVAPPATPSPPHPLLPIYDDRLELDGRPSLFVNYHADPAPVINRILDEIREVDPVGCPGLFLGRAHYLRPGGEWVYLYWFGLDFAPADRTCTPRIR
jgi:hypothetical protein